MPLFLRSTFSSRRSLPAFFVLIAGMWHPAISSGWQNAATAPAQPGQPAATDKQETEHKRLFGIVPNFRTSPSLTHYRPLTSAQKYKIASQDSFDRGTFVLAAAFAGESQLSKSNPSFGNGVAAYGRYFGTGYADFVIGDFMTEGIFPSLLHQDPRYFRKGKGSGFSRFVYAVDQLFRTHTDSGQSAFNYSEVLGNSMAVGISNAYYPDNRDASDAIVKLGTQLAVDGASNILKEFSPDIYRKFRAKRNRKTQ